MKFYDNKMLKPITCSKVIKNEDGVVDWCCNRATYATSIKHKDYDGRVAYYEIGFFYCDEHKPENADVVILNNEDKQ